MADKLPTAEKYIFNLAPEETFIGVASGWKRAGLEQRFTYCFEQVMVVGGIGHWEIGIELVQTPHYKIRGNAVVKHRDA